MLFTQPLFIESTFIHRITESNPTPSGKGGVGRARLMQIGKDQMSAFQEEWVRLDPFASEYIKAIELPIIARWP